MNKRTNWFAQKNVLRKESLGLYFSNILHHAFQVLQLVKNCLNFGVWDSEAVQTLSQQIQTDALHLKIFYAKQTKTLQTVQNIC